MKKAILIAVVLLISACAAHVPDNIYGEKDIVQDLYFQSDARIKTDLPTQKDKAPLVPSKYVHAYRGSYKDGRGNEVDDGWEWVQLRPETPNANF